MSVENKFMDQKVKIRFLVRKSKKFYKVEKFLNRIFFLIKALTRAPVGVLIWLASCSCPAANWEELAISSPEAKMVTSAHGTDGLLETPVGWRGIFIQVVDSFSKPISGILNIFRKVSIFLRVKSLAFCIKKLFQKALLERKKYLFSVIFSGSVNDENF